MTEEAKMAERTPPTEMPTETYDVVMVESSFFSSQDESDLWRVRGFPTLELAEEFARRWVRSCVEEARRAGGDGSGWRAFGESASVPGHYYAADEVEYFIAHPATPEEVDWQAVKRQSGLPG